MERPEPNETEIRIASEIRVGSALGDLANVSHQKGDVGLITISRDRFDAMTSPTSSLSSNFFTLMVGVALTIYISLESGGVKPESQATFRVALWFSLSLVVFFGILAAAQEWRKYKFRKEFKTTPSTPVH